jgi:hypothetical protein
MKSLAKALCLSPILILSLLFSIITPVESGATPPPSPTEEARSRFIAAEHEAAFYDPDLSPTRAVHD